jgi:hypothetical protein
MLFSARIFLNVSLASLLYSVFESTNSARSLFLPIDLRPSLSLSGISKYFISKSGVIPFL